jgi:hypothetical protein
MLINSKQDEYFFCIENMLYQISIFYYIYFATKIYLFFYYASKNKRIIKKISITLLPSSPNQNRYTWFTISSRPYHDLYSLYILYPA